MNIIEVKNLSFSYPDLEVIRDISFDVEKGTFMAIAGPNGVGKSTLLNLLCGLLKPSKNTIKIEDKTIESYLTKELASKVSVVRQEFVPVFGFSVLQAVLMARTPYYNQIGFETEQDRKIVTNALEATDTAQFASRTLAHLSGGERQRVFIARALAQDTDILLLDEPTTYLDLKHQVGIYDLLKQAQMEQGKTIIAITHDINLAAQYADVTLLLASDKKYYTGDTKDVFSKEQIEKVFSVPMFSGNIGQGRFLLPLGKFAKDNYLTTPNLDDKNKK